ncbi:peptide ABC transporter substrate-binding protein [Scleromatobacter humisilvae]|uniref:Peptide ABC transporter substrate-binding protein n=1 Tax=Scleromatobacter humisilvae TaxID=2897159 RepID=A0A9X1YNV9_9BURK|nr:peptide ABC transporter substrate-binding protein [Scleromatobacter humisilvae]MCK9689633.1 peptide ABC transporter substrate-binding protein [Scleromatobacter humisilvae]
MIARRCQPRLDLVVALVLAGCVSAAWCAVIPPGTVLDTRQEMVRNTGFEPDSLDPSISQTDGSIAILSDVFESLTALDGHDQVVPGMAESWRRVDALTWVFKLRPNAMWSDGTPVTAGDFVYSWRRFLDPRMAAFLASSIGVVVSNGAEIVAGKKPPTALGVRAVDSATLEVTTAVPTPYLPQLLAVPQFAPLPRATIEKLGKDWTKPGNMVSNGPYLLRDWQVNSKVVLVKNPRYWDAPNVVLTRVTYLPVEDATADLKMYQTGENDMTQTLPPGSFQALKAQYPKEIHNSIVFGLRYYALNNNDPLLKDVRVRKALSMVIDRDILATKVTADGQVPAYGLMVKGVVGADVVRYDWAGWPMARRVTEARKLLLEAGVQPGTHLKFTYNASEYHRKVGLFTASEWKTKLGLETEMDSLEFKVLVRRRQDAQYQIARDGWIPFTPDPTGMYTLVRCGSEANDSKYCNRHADDLVHQGELTTDPSKRQALMTEAARLVMEDYPLIPLVQYSVPRLVKPYIGGYDEVNVQDVHRSKDLFIVKH